MSGGLLIEGCPDDDRDPTGALYCGVYHPLTAGDPTVPSQVVSGGTTVQLHGGTDANAAEQ